jgi:hypothetical protein
VKIEIETEPVIAPDYDSWVWKRKTSREREIPAMRPDAKNKQNGEEHPNLAAGIELSGKTNGAAAADQEKERLRYHWTYGALR